MNRRSLFKFLFGGAASVAAAKLAPNAVAPTVFKIADGIEGPVFDDHEQHLRAQYEFLNAMGPLLYVEEDGSMPDLPDLMAMRPGSLYASRGRLRVLEYPRRPPLDRGC